MAQEYVWRTPLHPLVFDRLATDKDTLNHLIATSVEQLQAWMADNGHTADLPTMTWQVHDPRGNPLALAGDWPFLLTTMKETQ